MFPVRAVLLERGQVRNSYNSPSVLEGRVRQSIARSARPLVVEAEGVAQAPDVALDVLREELRLIEASAPAARAVKCNRMDLDDGTLANA